VFILVDKMALGQVSASMSGFPCPYYPISAQYSHWFVFQRRCVILEIATWKRELQEVNINLLNVTVLHRKHTLFSLQNNGECCWVNSAVSSHNQIKRIYRVWAECGPLILKHT
jgi:hypothetical protein